MDDGTGGDNRTLTDGCPGQDDRTRCDPRSVPDHSGLRPTFEGWRLHIVTSREKGRFWRDVYVLANAERSPAIKRDASIYNCVSSNRDAPLCGETNGPLQNRAGGK
jgi:hypothetical protein